MHPLIAVLLGTVTGAGGGPLGEMMLARVPEVLRADSYATAALAGAATMVISRKFKLPATWAALRGGTVCFLLRVISVCPLEFTEAKRWLVVGQTRKGQL
jgi:uncharacterized membrane protein YeiH